MNAKKNLSLSIAVVFCLAAGAEAGVIGDWTNVGNVYKFNVFSDIGNVTSLELRFRPVAGSTFQVNFEENLFDSDGLLAGQPDSFFLFPPSVTSPGMTQAKSPNLLQAAFTGFTPFASRDVAQLIVQGTQVRPIPSDFNVTDGTLGKAVVETIAGDANSRREFPILMLFIDNFPPEISPLVQVVTLGVNDSVLNNLQLVAVDEVLPPEEIVWSDLVIEGPGKNPGFPNATDPQLNSDGVFSWNPNGWRGGQYKFTATVADEAYERTELALTVNLIVPEPGSAWLILGLVIGSAGNLRRREFV